MTVQVALIVGLVIAMDLVVICVLIPAVVRDSCGVIAAAFPSSEIAPDAVRKNFQSFRFNLLGLGGCVHVAADERFLHLRPARLARLLGVKPASVPWEEIKPVKRGWRNDVVQIRGVRVVGPRWALGLAAK